MIDETPLGPQLDRELTHLELTPQARDRFLTALHDNSPAARAGADRRPPRWRVAVVAVAVAAVVCIPVITIQQLREGGKAVPTVRGGSVRR